MSNCRLRQFTSKKVSKKKCFFSMITRSRRRSQKTLTCLDEDCILLIISFCDFKSAMFTRLSVSLYMCIMNYLKHMKVCHHRFTNNQFINWTLAKCPSLTLPFQNNIIQALYDESKSCTDLESDFKFDYLNHSYCRTFYTMDLSKTPSRICLDEQMKWTYWWMRNIIINSSYWANADKAEPKDQINISQATLIVGGDNVQNVLRYFTEAYTIILCHYSLKNAAL